MFAGPAPGNGALAVGFGVELGWITAIDPGSFVAPDTGKVDVGNGVIKEGVEVGLFVEVELRPNNCPNLSVIAPR